MRRLTFTVFGTVQPKGSMRAFVPKGWKRPIVTSANPRLKDWEQNVRACAQQYAADYFFDEAVILELAFYLPRPKSAPKSRTHMVTRPDLSKCIRSTEDALIGVLFTDDSYVVGVKAFKQYAADGSAAHAVVTVRTAPSILGGTYGEKEEGPEAQPQAISQNYDTHRQNLEAQAAASTRPTAPRHGRGPTRRP